MGQIVFDLVVIGLLLAVAGARMMSWAQVTVEESEDGGFEIGVSQMPEDPTEESTEESSEEPSEEQSQATGEIDAVKRGGETS